MHRVAATRLEVGDPAVTVTPSLLRIVAGAFLLIMAAAIALYIRRRRAVAALVGDRALLRQLLGADLHRLPGLRLALVLLATAALTLALLDPTVSSAPPTRMGPAVLLLDASGSMLTDDVGPRRIDLQRELAEELAAELSEVPVGIVAFAGRAYALSPPTLDRTSVAMYLESLDPTIVTQSGSAVGAAIRQGLGLLSAAGTPAGGSLVLFSDGDDTEDADAALEAAELARENGVQVHVVGVGTPAGGPVPALDIVTGAVEGFLRNPDGSVLVSRLGVDLLESIARAGGGAYVAAGTGSVVERLAPLFEAPAAPDPAPDGLPLYAWLAGAALLLLVVEPLTDPVRRRR